jgi:hypothetical protein
LKILRTGKADSAIIATLLNNHRARSCGGFAKLVGDNMVDGFDATVDVSMMICGCCTSFGET